MDASITNIAKVVAITRLQRPPDNPIGLVERFISLNGGKAELKPNGRDMSASVETSGHLRRPVVYAADLAEPHRNEAWAEVHGTLMLKKHQCQEES